MSDPRIRLAVVGAGVIGRHHARAALAQGGFAVAALVDPVRANLEQAGEVVSGAGGGRPVLAATLAEALGRTGVDLVAVCAPSGLHVGLAEEAVAAGAHVLIEKPLDTDLPRARRIAELARGAVDRGRVVSVVSQHRLDPASLLVARTAHAGGFGRVTSGVASLAWYRSQEYYDSGDWRGTWALDGGGAAMNQGVHTIDLLVWTLGRPVEIAGAIARLGHRRIEVEDVAVATVRFASGALGVIHATTDAYPGLTAQYSVYGTRGSAAVVDDRLAYFHSADHGDDARASAPTTSGAAAAPGAEDQKDGLVPPEHVAGGPPEPDRFLAGHVRQYADVAAAIRDGRPPAVGVDDALLSLAVVRGLYVSATLGHPVRVDDVLGGRYDDVVPRLPDEEGDAG